MADVQESEQGTESAAEATCLPCRGTGSVVSYLGGDGNSIPCPWCAGTGARQPGIDAQARWQAAAAGEPDAPEAAGRSAATAASGDPDAAAPGAPQA